MAWTRTTSAVVRSFSEGDEDGDGHLLEPAHVADAACDGEGVHVQIGVQEDGLRGVVAQPEEGLLGRGEVADGKPLGLQGKLRVDPKGLVGAHQEEAVKGGRHGRILLGNLRKPCEKKLGWGGWTQTTTGGSKVRCPAVRRRPSAGPKAQRGF